MTTPRVLCVMLAAGRQAMVDRAIRCFESQSYPNRRLLVLDSGSERLKIHETLEVYRSRLELRQRTIGELRNIANASSARGALDCEIITHWDSDDWSHPDRLRDQVKLLEDSWADAVGYYQMLFWDTTNQLMSETRTCRPLRDSRRGTPSGQAWMFSSPNKKYCLGTSLVYWRKTWEKQVFAHRNTAEDTLWTLRLKTAATSSILATFPMMVASIHGENTCSQIKAGAREWKRAPRFDGYCREAMRF